MLRPASQSCTRTMKDCTETGQNTDLKAPPVKGGHASPGGDHIRPAAAGVKSRRAVNGTPAVVTENGSLGREIEDVHMVVVRAAPHEARPGVGHRLALHLRRTVGRKSVLHPIILGTSAESLAEGRRGGQLKRLQLPFTARWRVRNLIDLEDQLKQKEIHTSERLHRVLCFYGAVRLGFLCQGNDPSADGR